MKAWIVRAQWAGADGTTTTYEHKFNVRPTVQLWDSGRAICIAADSSYCRIFRRVDWIEREQIEES